MTIEPVFSWIPALGCALLLAAATAHKLREGRDFVAVVENYRIVPARFAPVASTFVILSELSAAAFLVFPGTRAVGAAAAALLFMVYAGAIALNLIRGRTHIDCGCLGASKHRSIGKWMVWRNMALAMVAALAAVPSGSRVLSALDAVTICGSLIALAPLYAAFNQLGSTTSRTSTAS